MPSAPPREARHRLSTVSTPFYGDADPTRGPPRGALRDGPRVEPDRRRRRGRGPRPDARAVPGGRRPGGRGDDYRRGRGRRGVPPDRVRLAFRLARVRG